MPGPWEEKIEKVLTSNPTKYTVTVENEEQASQSLRKSTLNIHWKDWCRSSDTLATFCEEPIHWKRPWCWERLRAGGEGDSRGWDGWMASPIPWTGVWTTLGDGEGQRSLACCHPWGRKESDMTEQLNNNSRMNNVPQSRMCSLLI